MWEPNGRRTNTLDIIPINSSYGDIPVEHEFNTRIYQVKESVNGINSLVLTLTDTEGNHIDFIDNYVVKLAFFFTRVWVCLIC